MDMGIIIAGLFLFVGGAVLTVSSAEAGWVKKNLDVLGRMALSMLGCTSMVAGALFVIGGVR